MNKTSTGSFFSADCFSVAILLCLFVMQLLLVIMFLFPSSFDASG